MAHLKRYQSREAYGQFCTRYWEYTRTLNGMERPLMKNLPERERRWSEIAREEGTNYGDAAQIHAAAQPTNPEL